MRVDCLYNLGFAVERFREMGRLSENPCRNIVSFRVNDSEKRLLNRWSRVTGMNISALMRELFSNKQNSISEILDKERIQQ